MQAGGALSSRRALREALDAATLQDERAAALRRQRHLRVQLQAKNENCQFKAGSFRPAEPSAHVMKLQSAHKRKPEKRRAV